MWILIILIVIVFCIGIVYGLYLIGKRTKQKEEEFKKMFDENVVKKKLKDYKKYQRKSTPKVPTIKK